MRLDGFDGAIPFPTLPYLQSQRDTWGKTAIERMNVIVSSPSRLALSARRRGTGRAPRNPAVSCQPLLMELNVPAADEASGPDLGHCTGYRDTELIVDAGLAMVFHGDGEGARRSTAAARPGEQDPLR